MADEQSAGQTAQEKLILIVANCPKSFEAAANFLSRRGFQCTAVSDIRQAIKIITNQKPAFVFLSWNLKNAKIMQTYSLFTKTFKATVVVFAEMTDSKTAAEVASSHLPETMQAPVSGPGIYMRIQKIEKSIHDLESLSDQTLAPKQVNVEEVPAEGTWEADQNPDPVTGQQVWRFKTDKSKLKGHYTFKGKKPPSKKPNGGWETEGGAPITYLPKAQNDPAEKGTDEAKSNADGATLSDSEIEALAEKVLQNKSPTGKGPITGEEEVDESAYGSIMKIGANAKKKAEGSIIQKGVASSENELPTFEGAEAKSFEYKDSKPKSEAKEHSASQLAPEGKEFSVAHHQAQSKEMSIKTSKSAEFKMSGKQPDSILAKSSAKALQASVKPSTGPVAPLELINKAMVFTVKSERFKGYLVVTSSEPTTLDSEVLAKLKEKIPSYMQEAGETLSDLEMVLCQVESVEFNEWSSKEAEFSATVGHLDHEWAISYFPEENPLPSVAPQANSDMVSVDIIDVLPESPLPFDIYIYLPVNDKHFLYVKKGKKLGQNQRERLKDQAVSHFFIKDSSIEQFKKFCIENKVGFKVVQFNTRSKAS